RRGGTEIRAEADVGYGREIGVDLEDVLVGKIEADALAPVASELVLPLLGLRVLLDDEADLRRPRARVVGRRAGIPSRHETGESEARGLGIEAVAHVRLADHGRAVPRVKDRGVDLASV